MRAAAAPQQQPRFRRLAAFQGVSAFSVLGGVGWRGKGPAGGDVSARYVRSALAPMKGGQAGFG